MVAQCPNRPARGSASAIRVGLPLLGESCPHCRRLWVFQARGTRKVEGCAGRRSRPAQRAEAKRTPEQPARGRRDDPLRFRCDELLPRHRSANLNHRAIPRRLGFEQFDERPHHPFTPLNRIRSMT